MAAKIARFARLELLYRGADIGGQCVSTDYTDHADGQLDEICFDLEDRDLRWQGPWMPAKSEKISAAIHCHHWFAEGDHLRLDCGEFEIQEVCLSGPPDMVNVRATASPVSKNVRQQKKTVAWERIDLRTIAGHVAESAGLELVWEGANQFYQRVDQREESDMKFLKRLCKDAGNSIKVADGNLIVYEGKKFDQRGPHGRIERGVQQIKTYRFGTGCQAKYCGCEVDYWHPDFRERFRGKCYPPDAPETGEVLRINQEVKSVAEADQLAAAALRRQNRDEVTVELTLLGDPGMRATQVQDVQGFGKYSGKYFIDQARHTIDGSGGYTTTISGRKVLGY